MRQSFVLHGFAVLGIEIELNPERRFEESDYSNDVWTRAVTL